MSQTKKKYVCDAALTVVPFVLDSSGCSCHGTSFSFLFKRFPNFCVQIYSPRFKG